MAEQRSTIRPDNIKIDVCVVEENAIDMMCSGGMEPEAVFQNAGPVCIISFFVSYFDFLFHFCLVSF